MRKRVTTWYWISCGATTFIGVIYMIYILIYPPLLQDQSGNLSGEMPSAFGLAVDITFLGLLGTLIGAIIAAAARLLKLR